MTEQSVPTYPLVIVESTPDDADTLTGQLSLLGATAIEQRDETTLQKGGPLGVTLIASFDTWQEAQTAVDELGPNAKLDQVVGDDWKDAWKEHWKPTRLGSHIVVVPSWTTYTPLESDIVLQLDPGRAFGSGQHPSTAMVAAALETTIPLMQKKFHDVQVLDIGCGSGILAFIAALLGARSVTACDIDPEAVRCATENCIALGMQNQVKFQTDTARTLDKQLQGHIVVANIEASVLIPDAEFIASHLVPQGTLILSGLLSHQRDAILETYAKHGCTLQSITDNGEWICPVLQKH